MKKTMTDEERYEEWQRRDLRGSVVPWGETLAVPCSGCGGELHETGPVGGLAVDFD